jgi:hypothetical protein
MMAMANDMPTPKWRNFGAWGAVGAVLYILAVCGGTWLLQGGGVGELLGAIPRSKQLAAALGLGLLFSTAFTGFTQRKRPLSPRNFRNFMIQNAVAVIACLLVIWCFGTLARSGPIGASEWAAAVTGATLVVIACLGMFATASVRAGVDLVDDEMAADDMRERGRLMFCSLAWIAACGLLLILLGLAGPGGVLPPATALASALVLIAILTVLGIAAWRMSDELGRTLSYETGNMAFYLIWVLGSGWAMLAHLGFVAGPAPLDLLTLFTVLLFAASFIVLGRRKLLIR